LLVRVSTGTSFLLPATISENGRCCSSRLLAGVVVVVIDGSKTLDRFLVPIDATTVFEERRPISEATWLCLGSIKDALMMIEDTQVVRYGMARRQSCWGEFIMRCSLMFRPLLSTNRTKRRVKVMVSKSQSVPCVVPCPVRVVRSARAPWMLSVHTVP
jgi:hypothetical protein